MNPGYTPQNSNLTHALQLNSSKPGQLFTNAGRMYDTTAVVYEYDQWRI